MLKLAENISHIGTESAFEVLARANQLEQQGRSIINLGIGQPDFQTPDNIVEAGIRALKDGHHGYTPANGIPLLREAVAEDLYKRLSVEISPDNVLIVPGGKVTMFFAVMMFGEPGTEILFPNPGFPIYESVINYSGAKAIPYGLLEKNNFGFTAESILSEITDNTSLIILNSPANPTGGITSQQELDKLVKGLQDFPHVCVLSDEIYSQMLYEGHEHISMLNYPEMIDRTVLLDGWSKTYAMTGWRLGYSVWPKDLIDKATKLCINSHSCVNAAAQFAGLEALTGSQNCIAEMVSAFDQRRQIITEGLNNIPQVSCIKPLGAFYAFLNISKTGLSAKEIEVSLLETAGIATIAGSSFGSNGEGYIRLSYANSITNIEEALDRLHNWFKKELR